MTVGLPSAKVDIDNRAGYLALQLRDTFNSIQVVKDWLDTQTDATLTSLGYSAGDITTLRAAFTDLSNLGKVAHAQATQASANDFFFNAKKLTGVV